ncbi:MAG: hypothetical protein QOH16_3111 [Gaiellaceae bacterium]|jgi:hypothetical protein|nr:hypothetical protein [Gaiellaceae bacterium]
MAIVRRADDGTWSLEVEAGEVGRNADHDEAYVRYLNAFDPIFVRARETCEFEFILTLLRVSGLQGPGWDAYNSTRRAINAARELHELIPAGDEHFEKARHLELWTYGHVVEASEPYAMLANLLDVIRGERFNARRFPPDARGRPQVVASKIDQLVSLARRAGFEGAMDPLREIYDRELRNAIFHADYALHGGNINLTDAGRTIAHDDFMRLLNRALAYHDAIDRLHSTHVSSYTEPLVLPAHPAFADDEQAAVIIREDHGVVGLKHNLTPAEIANGGIQWRLGIFQPYELAALNADPHLALLPARR